MIVIFIFIVGLFIIVNVLYFILPSLAPIPFFPTNKRDLSMIIDTLLKKTHQGEDAHFKRRLGDPSGEAREEMRHQAESVIIDLGAGTGTVLFAAARLKNANNTKFIAVEIHPLLVLIMNLRRLFHPNRKNIIIMRKDIFKLDYSDLLQYTKYDLRTTIYLYVGPFVMERLKKTLSTFPKKTRIVSYMYEIPGWDKYLTKKEKGVHGLYTYSI